jgi:hypothetical protein
MVQHELFCCCCGCDVAATRHRGRGAMWHARMATRCMHGPLKTQIGLRGALSDHVITG